MAGSPRRDARAESTWSVGQGQLRGAERVRGGTRAEQAMGAGIGALISDAGLTQASSEALEAVPQKLRSYFSSLRVLRASLCFLGASGLAFQSGETRPEKHREARRARRGERTEDGSGKKEREVVAGSGAAEVVSESLDVVLAEVAAGLDFDEHKRLLADAFDAVRTAAGDVD